MDRVRAIARRIGYPLVVLVSLVHSGVLLNRGVDPTVATLVGVFVGLFGSASLELLVPFRDPHAEWRKELKIDVLHTIFTQGVVNLVVILALVGIEDRIAHGMAGRLGFTPWPTSWPMPVQVVLAVALGDLGFYLAHRWMHVSDFGWKFHRIHHSSAEMNVMSAARAHPGNSLFVYLAQVVPLQLLGMPQETAALSTVFIAVNGWLQHADADLVNPWLSWWLATAEVHRIHHLRESRYQATNLGGNMTIWDRLIGTWRPPDVVMGALSRFRPRTFGLSGESVAASYLAHLVAPFRPIVREAIPETDPRSSAHWVEQGGHSATAWLPPGVGSSTGWVAVETAPKAQGAGL